MLRDKTYVRIDNGMLFNVTGDEHPPHGVFASLKYVAGEKWVAGYRAATQFLLSKEPSFIDANGFVCIPIGRIKTTYDPFSRWSEIQAARNVSRLHREARDLASQLQEIMGVDDFGITDSLLWGEGHDQSDIDLLVRGRDNAKRLQRNVELLYEHFSFERPAPQRLAAPYGQSVDDWPRVLDRKLHMGCFRGRLFSLRVVLHKEEIEGPHTWSVVAPSVTVDFTVFESVDALLFPAIYRNAMGDELVDYSVVYEGVFREGDVIRCICEHLQVHTPNRVRNRFVLKHVIQF